jgi:hypothetical protein
MAGMAAAGRSREEHRGGGPPEQQDRRDERRVPGELDGEADEDEERRGLRDTRSVALYTIRSGCTIPGAWPSLMARTCAAASVLMASPMKPRAVMGIPRALMMMPARMAMLMLSLKMALAKAENGLTCGYGLRALKMPYNRPY